MDTRTVCIHSEVPLIFEQGERKGMGPVGAIWPTFTFLFGPDRFHTLDFRYRILFFFLYDRLGQSRGRNKLHKNKKLFFSF